MFVSVPVEKDTAPVKWPSDADEKRRSPFRQFFPFFRFFQFSVLQLSLNQTKHTVNPRGNCEKAYTKVEGFFCAKG